MATAIRPGRLPPMAMTWDTTRVNKTGSWRYLRPVYRNKTPPCHVGCPTSNAIERILYWVALNELDRAWEILTAENPFPAITGRVCHHPCESKCNRRHFDEAVGIREVERFLGDWALRAGKHVTPLVNETTDKRVAVVGGGPAGLACAYHLARLGHRVMVYEANPEPGGVLRYGIPDYRLPKQILKAELQKLEDLGVEIQTSARVGQDVPWEELQRQYDAIFVATGVWKSLPLGVPGEDLQGVLSGLQFLKALHQGESLSERLGERVVVIGGGNTAMDVARTALRLGKCVTIAYRRTRAEMPAIPEEIEEALAEGAELLERVAPTRILGEDGRVTGIELRKMRLGEPDESGRRRPIPIEGSEFVLEADAVIPAIGEAPDFTGLPEDLHDEWVVPVDGWGRVPGQKVFAGGDVIDQPHTVVDALASGKRAAIAIDLFLKGKLGGQEADEIKKRIELPQGGLSMRRYVEDPGALLLDNSRVVEYEQLNPIYFRARARTEAFERPPEARVRDFQEIKPGFDLDDALREAERCLHCGVCNECDNCFVFCPDLAVIRDAGADGRGYPYAIDYDYCKGCGICVQECPRAVLELIREGSGESGEGG